MNTGSDPGNTDHLATLPLDQPQGIAPGDAAGTLAYDTAEHEIASGQRSGESGSAGRLHRLWGAAAGSSQNIMHTMGGVGQASDSVFDRVAKRVVAGNVDGLQPPTPGQLADYQVIEKLGSGSMGVVYAARQTGIGRVVALKVMKDVPVEQDSPSATAAGNARQRTIEESPDEQQARRRAARRRKEQQATQSRRQLSFFYEAQITGDLNHPNIVPIYELGISQDGMLFYSMKQIIGTEWQYVIADKSRDENIDILMKVADAVAFAHSRGVIHRDLKPQNTMLGAYGEVLVTDWGLAVKPAEDRSFGMGGSPAYMAPEMAGHKVNLIGPGSDIYLLGAILFQIITGQPPHTGKTLTECCANAFNNEIVAIELADPLLDIAYRAMAADPGDRYATVEDFQEAIREYQRHSQSVVLVERSAELLAEAGRTKNYEQFSRAVFGFQDALELWPANRGAQTGLHRARLAYGKCAFDKGDFDLCLQALDQSNPEEAKLYREAVTARAEADARGKRFQRLRKVLAATILAALVGMSGLAGVAWWQRGVAVAKEQEALVARDNALAAQEKERLAKEAEEQAKRDALVARDNALAAQEKERLAKEAEEKQRLLAVAAQRDAENRAAQVELRNYSSNLALARARIDQLQVAEAQILLNQIVNPDSYRSMRQRGRLPHFDNWALKRGRLLANEDLPQLALAGRVMAADFASAAGIGVAGTADGRVLLWRLGSDPQTGEPRLEAVRELKVPGPVDSLAVSANADEVVYSIGREGEESTVWSWRPASEAPPVAIRDIRRRSIQGLALTPSFVLAGINGGIRIWDRRESWPDDRPVAIVEQIRGRLQSLQLLDGDRALIAAALNDRVRLYELDLRSGASQPRLDEIGVPDTMVGDVTAAAASPGGERLLLGLRDGRIVSCRYAAAPAGSGTADGQPAATDMECRELLPRLHQSPVHAIRVNTDGTLLSFADEPAVQVWRPNREVLAGWEHSFQLAGTRANVAATTFAGSADRVFAAGLDGQALLWDVRRQKQRMRLERLVAGSDWNAESFVAPLAGMAFAEGDQPAVLAVDGNGMFETWDAADGRTILQADPGTQGATYRRWAYFGHSPGSELLDVAMDEAAGTIVTLARLPSATVPERAYCECPADHDREYCQWNLQTGALVRRWTRAAPWAQRISLVDGGRRLVGVGEPARSNSTDEIRLAGVPEALGSAAFATMLALTDPSNPRRVMLVRSNGGVELMDLDRPERPVASQYYLSDLDPPVVVRAAWSQDGRLLVLLLAEGRIAMFAVEGDSVGRPAVARLAESEGELARIRSHWNADLVIEGTGENTVVWAGLRESVSGGQFESVLLRAVPGESPVLEVAGRFDGQRFLLPDAAGHPEFRDQPERPTQATPSAIAGLVSAPGQCWVAQRDGTLIRCGADGQPEQVLGRMPVAGASSGAAGRVMLLAGTGGDLWRVERKEPAAALQWTLLAPPDGAIRKIDLHPAGEQAIVSAVWPDGRRTVSILSARDGSVIRLLDGRAAAIWHRESPDQLVAVDAAGRVGVVSVADGATEELGQIALPEGARCELHWFIEAWEGADPDLWLLVHVDGEDGGRISFVPVSAGAVASRAGAGDQTSALSLPEVVPPGARIATSPREGLYVVGASGSVSVWFAAPGLEEPGKQIFDLPGHTGAAIGPVSFSPDGSLLVTTDSRARLFGWMSVDARRGLVPESR